MYDLWSLCLGFFFIYNVIADINPTKSDEMSDFDDNRAEGYKSHSDIKSKWRFINRISLPIDKAPFASPQLSPSKLFYKVPIIESTKILLSLRNLGESTFNITALTGYIHAAHRFSFYVQNSTARQINAILRPNGEISLEYRFIPWKGLPIVDYVFSCDIEYGLVINPETDSKRIPISYKYQFMNVTINIYDSAPMNWIDFQLFFMTISIAVFWAFVGVLFYELWWIPNQEAQGNAPLSTQDWLLFMYNNYVRHSYYSVREKVTNTPNPMKSDENNGNNTKNKASPKKQNDSWLKGTSGSTSKQRKKKKKN